MGLGSCSSSFFLGAWRGGTPTARSSRRGAPPHYGGGTACYRGRSTPKEPRNAASSSLLEVRRRAASRTTQSTVGVLL